MTVRMATPDDADAIERVRTDTWRAAYRGLMPDTVLDALTYDGTRRREYMKTMSVTQFMLVAEHDREIVGFVNGGPTRFADAAHPGEIYAIYVLPAHHGHGHGSSLMRAGARELIARGWRGMHLWVLRDNAPSRLFYERMGGRYTHDREDPGQGVTLIESGYAWDDIGALTTSHLPDPGPR
jgi:ribosomal protein S18 acetylase RimI-like enzyme